MNSFAVLGVDAAWTLKEPSGVALVVAQIPRSWRLVASAPCYQHFLARADQSLARQARPSGSKPDPEALLQAAAKLAGRTVDLVAVDMPLALSPIIARRASDNAVSKEYGARHASTHTPSATRPGLISDELAGGFARAGYPLQTERIEAPGLIEVYPHPALIELADAPRRLPYKLSKIRNYWPDLSVFDRRARLFEQWAEIIQSLDRQITGVAKALPPPDAAASGVTLKAWMRSCAPGSVLVRSKGKRNHLATTYRQSGFRLLVWRSGLFRQTCSTRCTAKHGSQIPKLDFLNGHWVVRTADHR